MGRPPCCDKARIKKGPWTPEEDIILVSYIKEHGPGNWRLVPTNSGLMRCSKSCRLRWTNYLRPGIKRGNFNPHEEGIIIQLQALLGNRWAAIASYLPQRTDNDIKNYWNTHLKKKMKYQAAMSSHITSSDSAGSTSHEIVLGDHCTDEIRNSGTSNSHILTHSSSTYASSAENISRLLEGWMRSSPNHTLSDEKLQHQMIKENININNNNNSCIMNQLNIDVENNSQLPLEDSVIAWDKTATDSFFELNSQFKIMAYDHHKLIAQIQQPPISMLEKWLLEENTGQMDTLLEFSAADCCSETMF